MKRAALLLLIASGACHATDAKPRGAPATVAADDQPAPRKPAPASPAKAAKESEREELQRLIASVTEKDRAQFKEELDQMAAARDKAAQKARTLFALPARECCSGAKGCAARQRDFRGLCYDNPDEEAWGLGPLTVDDAGVFWMQDAAVDRIVGFDKTGKLVRGYYLESGLVAHHLVATATEFWLDSFSASETNTRLLRVDRATGKTRAYAWKDVLGGQYQGSGWQMPDNPSRVMRWGASWTWNVVDVSFLDDTRMQISAPHPLHVRGHRYFLDCDVENKRPATLVIDDHATPAAGCSQLEYVGADGDTIAGTPFVHYDVHGTLLGIATREPSPYAVLTDGNDSAVGPDGKIYQYVTQKDGVRFVELPLFPQ